MTNSRSINDLINYDHEKLFRFQSIQPVGAIKFCVLIYAYQRKIKRVNLNYNLH